MIKNKIKKGLVISIVVLFIGIEICYVPKVKSEEIWENYHLFEEIEDIITDLASDHSNIAILSSIGETIKSNKIWCLEISDNPGIDEGEPIVLFTGLTHANEWPTVNICLCIAQKLTDDYNEIPEITNIVNNTRILIVPCVNPDGYKYSHDNSPPHLFWRKNRNDTGVDLNRNFGGSCDGNILGAWGSTGQFPNCSHNPLSPNYFGSEPFSEYETQAIRDLIIDNDITAMIHYHTSGEIVARPWGYKKEVTPDENYLSFIGERIAENITNQSGEGHYLNQLGFDMQQNTGNARDWAYGYYHYVKGTTTFSYVIEACAFPQPLENKLDQICVQNFNGAKCLLNYAHSIKVNGKLRVLPPTIDPMGSDSDGNYTVSWEENNPTANPDKFQLDELTDLQTIEDNGTLSPNYWDFDGFTFTNQRYHSYRYSYKSSNDLNSVSAMTPIYPYRVSMYGTKLHFYCWYQIKTLYPDKGCAFVEISTDGRKYNILDKFTGDSNGWEYHEYSLNNYVGKSIFIRFRYTTRGLLPGEGFFVDDIYPAAYFGTVSTLSDNINENYYIITYQPSGKTYYYQVRGHNNDERWGDFSTLEDILVMYGIPHDP